jgi:hypothetical protein
VPELKLVRAASSAYVLYDLDELYRPGA